MVRRTVKYYDIVPQGTAKKISAADFRRALRNAGMVPLDKSAVEWKGASDAENAISAIIISSDSPIPFYTNTKTLSVSCPHCNAAIPCNDWRQAVEVFRRSGVPIVLKLSCCGNLSQLSNLKYDPPVYFACSAISIYSGDSPEDELSELARLKRTLETETGIPMDCFERHC